MADRDNRKRIDKMLDALTDRFEGVGYAVRSVLLSYIGENEAEVKKTSELLKSKGGGFSLFGGDSDEPLKHLRRATVLADIALGKAKVEQIPRLQTEIDRLSEKELGAHLTRVFENWAKDQQPVPLSRDLKLVFSPSFLLASSLEQQEVLQSVTQAARLLDSSVKMLKMIRSRARARSAYSQWFGAFTEARYKKVLDNFEALSAWLAAKEVLLFYRARGLRDRKRITELQSRIAKASAKALPGGHGELPLPPNFGNGQPAFNGNSLVETVPSPSLPVTEASPEPSDAYGYTYAGRGYDRKYIYFGNLFFDTSQRMGTSNTAGVFIHEMSHAVCKTDDVSFLGTACYGHLLCMTCAKVRPDDACNNADNYEFFAEEWQKDHYDLDAKFKQDAADAKAKAALTPKLRMRLGSDLLGPRQRG